MELIQENKGAGVFGEVVALVITGLIVTYFLLIFSNAFLPDVFTVIDSSVGVELGNSIKFLLGALVFFIVIGLLVKIWNVLTSGGTTYYG